MKKIIDFLSRIYILSCCFCYGVALGIIFVAIPYLLIIKLSIIKLDSFILNLCEFCLIIVGQLIYFKTYKWILPK